MREAERKASDRVIRTAKWVTIIEAHPDHRDVFDDRPGERAHGSLSGRANRAPCGAARTGGEARAPDAASTSLCASWSGVVRSPSSCARCVERSSRWPTTAVHGATCSTRWSERSSRHTGLVTGDITCIHFGMGVVARTRYARGWHQSAAGHEQG